jgi:hypothetical protein
LHIHFQNLSFKLVKKFVQINNTFFAASNPLPLHKHQPLHPGQLYQMYRPRQAVNQYIVRFTLYLQQPVAIPAAEDTFAVEVCLA